MQSNYSTLVLLLSLFKYGSLLHMDESIYKNYNYDQNKDATTGYIDSFDTNDNDIGGMGYKNYSRQELKSPSSDPTAKAAFLNLESAQFLERFDQDQTYLTQIRQSKVHCELGIVINRSVLGYFKDPETLLDFLKKTIEHLNTIYSSNIRVDGKPVILFKIKTIHFDDGFEPYSRFINDHTQLLSAFNQYALSSYQVEHCLTILLTAVNWDNVLGMAFNRSKSGGPLSELNSCNNPMSCIVLTISMDEAYMNPQTTALVLAHEIEHAFGVSHPETENSPGMSADPNVEDESKQQVNIISSLNLIDTLRSSNIIDESYLESDNINIMNSILTIPRNLEKLRLSKDLDQVLRRIIVAGKNCFVELVDETCGDGVVDGTEECDTRLDKKCCSQTMNPHQCKFAENAKCTIADGPCCEENCQFKAKSSKCYDNPDHCQNSKVKCSGTSAKCHDDGNLEGYSCRSGKGICHEGKCILSVCEKLGGKPCDNIKFQCNVNCTFNGIHCDPYIDGLSLIPKKDGTRCSFNRGYCTNGYCSRDIQDYIGDQKFKPAEIDLPMNPHALKKSAILVQNSDISQSSEDLSHFAIDGMKEED